MPAKKKTPKKTVKSAKTAKNNKRTKTAHKSIVQTTANKKKSLNKAQKKRLAKKKAVKQVPELFSRAQKHPNQYAANKLVRRARRLAMRFRMSVQPHKHTFCNTCYTRFVVGTNCRVRIHASRVIYTCFSCGAHKRIPLKKYQEHNT